MDAGDPAPLLPDVPALRKGLSEDRAVFRTIPGDVSLDHTGELPHLADKLLLVPGDGPGMIDDPSAAVRAERLEPDVDPGPATSIRQRGQVFLYTQGEEVLP